MPAAVVIHCACPDEAVAERISKALVEERLAACVQRVPGVHSTYRWDGRVETGYELLLLIKTTPERIPAVFARVCELHPYDVPELLAIPVHAGLPAYLDWAADQTRADA